MSRPSILVLLVQGLLLGCSSPSPDPYQPLTPECETCLLESGPAGCGDSYQACAGVTRCETVILCELRQQCYAQSSLSSCSRDRGCQDGASMQALDEAAGFEACARTICAEPCFFVD